MFYFYTVHTRTAADIPHYEADAEIKPFVQRLKEYLERVHANDAKTIGVLDTTESATPLSTHPQSFESTFLYNKRYILVGETKSTKAAAEESAAEEALRWLEATFPFERTA